MPEFKATVMDFFGQCDGLSLRILEATAIGLGLVSGATQANNDCPPHLLVVMLVCFVMFTTIVISHHYIIVKHKRAYNTALKSP